MGRRYKRITSIFCILLSIGFTGCDAGVEDTVSDQVIEVEAVKDPIEYTMDVVRMGDVANTVSIDCSYLQMEDEDIAFDVDNEVIYQVYVEKGDTVRKGDLLVELNVAELERLVDELKDSIAYQTLMLEQTKELKALDIKARKERYNLDKSQMTDVTMKSTLDRTFNEDIRSIEASYEKSIEDYEDTINIGQFKLDTYQEKIKSSKLYAGMDGTVSFIKDYLRGSLTKVDEKIITIIDTSVCAFAASKIEYRDYFKEKEPITITIGFGANEQQREAYPMNINEWDDEMYFELAENDYELAIGTRGTIDITLETANNVLYISKDAIHTAQDQSYVYVVDSEGLRSIQYVEVGLRGPKVVEIKSGLKEGDYVILK